MIPKAPTKESSFIVATGDLETDPFRGPSHPKGERIPESFCAGFYDGQTCAIDWGDDHMKKHVKRIVKFASKQDKKVLVFYHNGGKFDAHFMLAEILVILKEIFGLDELKLFCIGSRIVEIETPVCSFRDSFALIPKPLKSFAKKDDIEIEKLEPEVREKHKDEICKYLRQDCIGLYDGLSDFIQLYGIGLTLASTAFRILAKDFGGKIKRTGASYDEKFRKAFFAGRVQFFGLGKFGSLDACKRYEIVDINSSFPWSMTHSHWFSDKYALIEKINKEFKNECFYEIICDSDGALPVRTEKEGVSFPTVKQCPFFVSGYELFSAIKLGLVRKVRYNAIYLPEEINDFDAYVQHFYKLKKEAKTQAERDFAKLFLNACYGKFAQNNRDAKDSLVTLLGKIPEPRLDKKSKALALTLKIQLALMKQGRKKIQTKTIRGITGQIVEYEDQEFLLRPKTPPENAAYLCSYWELTFDDERRGLSFWGLPTEKKEGFNEFHNVATAASITALSRAKLSEAMHNSRGVLYCDTDSVLAESTAKLKKGDALGEWKLEKECDAVWIGGKKLYVAHSYLDKGCKQKPSVKCFKEVDLPKYKFRRWYVTKKDFDDSWKLASKGVRLKVEDLIAVCEGEERKFSFDAPNFSVRSIPRFTTRTVRRDDKRVRR